MAISAIHGVVRAPRIEADTVQVVMGSLRAVRCLEAGAGVCENLSYFPPLQYLPSALILWAGGGPGATMRGLVWLNLSAWLGTALLLALALRRGRGAWAAALGLAAWLGSYGLAYANSSFGEVLTGLLALAFTVGCARGWPWALVGVIGLLAGLGKETAPPFLALVGASALLPRWAGRPAEGSTAWRGVLALAFATGGSLATNAAFNLWRYGEAGNPFLLQPILRAPGVDQWLSSFAALWLSPNGGLLLVAPLAAALIAAGGTWSLIRALRRADGWPSAAPALGALAALAGMMAGLAGWYSPFGWWAWGPRLLLPWLPACIYLALTARLPWETTVARILSSGRGFAALAAVLGGAVAIHAAALVDSADYLAHFTHNPTCGVVVIQQDPVGFFDYLGCLMWNTDRFLLGHMLRAAIDPAAIWTALAAVALQVALLGRARVLLRDAAPRDARIAPDGTSVNPTAPVGPARIPGG